MLCAYFCKFNTLVELHVLENQTCTVHFQINQIWRNTNNFYYEE